jgi:hypothetical protein
MAPSWSPDQKGVKVHIVDVFALQLATGYEKDPQGRLLLHSEPSVSQGRSWSLAKACQLVRNDANPERWVVLHRHKKAWGLFWAGGGLDLCREELLKSAGTVPSSAIVPATPDALLRLILALEEPEESPVLQAKATKKKVRGSEQNLGTPFPWRVVAATSAVWLIISLALGVATLSRLQQQDAKLQQLVNLLERKAVR